MLWRRDKCGHKIALRCLDRSYRILSTIHALIILPFRAPVAHTSSLQHSFMHAVISLWNNLPNDATSSTSLTTMYLHCFCNYCYVFTVHVLPSPIRVLVVYPCIIIILRIIFLKIKNKETALKIIWLSVL